MPEIKNLTLRQKTLLDAMWALDTKEELFSFFEELNEVDCREAKTLAMLAALAAIDDEVDDMTEYPDAKQLLHKF